MKIYSESTSTDVGMICNFMNINIFTDIFIHFTVTNYLTKTTLRTIAHATPLISANKFWTALQKNKHCRTVKKICQGISIITITVAVWPGGTSGTCFYFTRACEYTERERKQKVP